ncbi:helix-turn-helix domain-containing protein [Exiguobacterium acetylicum]|uniref:helix-turn-helix domain-containing protein n=1 Tax=Exiguobacterium acetylicum TaxID=41170 RepID=UPI001EE18FEB|nr:helix-turn-helix domain-containing protein [Exiguobacterium acetylicum]UKS54812.1 helix-turn-helix transcriptional regulator [Exiguobacterium acetylicum]
MHPVIHSVGDKIKQERKKQRMTQKDLCEGICSQAEISKIENGRNSPTIDLLQQICRRLRIPISLFFEDEIVSQKLNEIDQKMLHHMREKTYSAMEKDLDKYAKSNTAFEVQVLIRYHQKLLLHEKGNIDFRTCISALLKLVAEENLVEKSFLLYTRIQMAIAVLYTNHMDYARSHQIYEELLKLPYRTREYKKIKMKTMYNYLRNIYRLKRFEEGLQKVEQVIEEAKELQDLTYLGHFYYQKGFFLESLNASEKSIKEAYTIAYSFFTATNNHAYRKILETHLSDLLLFPIDESE